MEILHFAMFNLLAFFLFNIFYEQSMLKKDSINLIQDTEKTLSRQYNKNTILVVKAFELLNSYFNKDGG